MSYSSVVWLPNALILTALLALVAWWRWRAVGALVGIRWTGVALLPLALYGIGLYRLVWSVGLALSRFVTGFVWRPSVWFGAILLAAAVVLILVPTRMLRTRRAAASPTGSAIGQGSSARSPVRPSRSKQTGAAPDDDMADIQDILNRHGIG